MQRYSRNVLVFMNQKSDVPGFTFRALIIAISLSLFLLMSTAYIAIKLGAAPWPIIFAVIVSVAVIKITSRGKELNIHEINVAQAGGSIGGLVAAGVSFTLPGIIYLNQHKDMSIELPAPWLLGLLIATAGVLGLLLSVPLKYTFIDEENLPFPAGTAGAELIKVSKTGGKELHILLIIGSLVGIFTLVRDLYFPAGFELLVVSTLGLIITIVPLPIAIGGGYILGPRPGLSWLAGAIIGWFLLMPLFKINEIPINLAATYIKNIGMGMVLGSGVSFFLTYVLPRFRKIFLPVFQTNTYLKKVVPLVLGLGMISLICSGVPVTAALLTLVGIWSMVAVAARMTGETNIDPLEQFGIFVTLIVAASYEIFNASLPVETLFIIVTMVSIACAIAGDAGHDYKSAAILGTKFSDIIKIDLITVIVVGIAAPFVFEIIRQGFSDKLFTPLMPAPQARLVAESLIGFEHPLVFLTGFLIAFLGEILNKLIAVKYQNYLLWMPFGIGLFLGPGLAFPIAVGALIHLWVIKKKPDYYQTGILISAAVMGAEGIAGFSSGALTIFGISFFSGSFGLSVFFLGLFLLGVFLYTSDRKKSESL